MTESRFDHITGMDRPNIRRDGLLIDLAKCAWLLLGFALGAVAELANACWQDVVFWATGRRDSPMYCVRCGMQGHQSYQCKAPVLPPPPAPSK
jgi:hypothetical protein